MVQVMRPLYLNDYDSMVMAQVLHLMTINPYWHNKAALIKTSSKNLSAQPHKNTPNHTHLSKEKPKHVPRSLLNSPHKPGMSSLNSKIGLHALKNKSKPSPLPSSSAKS
jgi:hypothetical protein